MNPEENTTITICPPKGRGESISIIVSQKYIDEERLDVLQKSLQRAWQEFVYVNKWKIVEDKFEGITDKLPLL